MHGIRRQRTRFSTYSHHMHHMHKPHVSAFSWSNTLALGSCLCDNKSKTRQRQAVVLLLIPPRKPPRPLRPLRPFFALLAITITCISSASLRQLVHAKSSYGLCLSIAALIINFTLTYYLPNKNYCRLQ